MVSIHRAVPHERSSASGRGRALPHPDCSAAGPFVRRRQARISRGGAREAARLCWERRACLPEPSRWRRRGRRGNASPCPGAHGHRNLLLPERKPASSAQRDRPGQLRPGSVAAAASDAIRRMRVGRGGLLAHDAGSRASACCGSSGGIHPRRRYQRRHAAEGSSGSVLGLVAS